MCTSTSADNEKSVSNVADPKTYKSYHHNIIHELSVVYSVSKYGVSFSTNLSKHTMMDYWVKSTSPDHQDEYVSMTCLVFLFTRFNLHRNYLQWCSIKHLLFEVCCLCQLSQSLSFLIYVSPWHQQPVREQISLGMSVTWVQYYVNNTTLYSWDAEHSWYFPFVNSPANEHYSILIFRQKKRNTIRSVWIHSIRTMLKFGSQSFVIY